MSTLVLVHLGKALPPYIYDCILQCLVVNGATCKIFVVVDDTLVNEFNENINSLDVCRYFANNQMYSATSLVTAVPVTCLDNYLDKSDNWKEYKNLMNTKFGGQTSFRDGFWVSTTARFFYLEAVMGTFQLNSVFHIENDIVMYETFESITNTFKCKDELWMVQDSPERVVPSILYLPSARALKDLTKHITSTIRDSSTFVNDMQILGQWTSHQKRLFPVDPRTSDMILDGAAMGQYLGGVDTRNLPKQGDDRTSLFMNPSIGFVNETSVFKPNTCRFTRASIQTDIHEFALKVPLCQAKGREKLVKVANLHIHSKQLYKFASIYDMDYRDIIAGDRIVSLCDFVVCTWGMYNFHKGLDKFAKDVIAVQDWRTVDIQKLNNYFREFCAKNKKNEVKLHLYTHILLDFQEYVLDHLDASISYVLYIHNSDHPFDKTYNKTVNCTKIRHIYAQNIDYPEESTKLTLLPIGIANSMWKHGDLLSLYEVMSETYKYKKSKGIYVNINPSTYDYRKELLDMIKRTGCWSLAESKPYSDYLRELSQHRFCLCVRGNGLDTHRFWESLYLGVIPVIVINQRTQMTDFVRYLQKLDVPFVALKEDNLEKLCERYTESYFDDILYTTVMKKSKCALYTNSALKLKYYDS